MQANAYGYSAPPGGMYTGASSGMLGYRGNYAEQVNSGFQQTLPSAYPDQAHGHAGSGVTAAYGRTSGSPPGFSGGPSVQGLAFDICFSSLGVSSLCRSLGVFSSCRSPLFPGVCTVSLSVDAVCERGWTSVCACAY
ncbi:putative ER lumen protein retaining receptor [Toxoplasma gondii RUB]|uniref:Putative ER lumen protein retaining receptor n=1 Tax=Toxoplasma gondii RUB TaxID=935652 RepID=A0A086LNC7_TOXGO|nr:putative ER lumen protein retaining receptor [Toxoplasma gondii RUB]